MISRKHTLRLLAGVAASLTATGWGCLSMQSQSTLDAANGATPTGNQPYVEAYIEYPGPQSKWSGPASYILHVTAKDAGPAQITATPELLQAESTPEIQHRLPASSALSHAAAAAHGTAATFKAMTSDEARAQLAYLANSLQGAQAPFRGCMSPVRIRMVRADGAIVEKQGCRSELGWSRAVSETVSSFVDASTHGMQSKPSSEPVRAISSVAAQPEHAAVAETTHGHEPAAHDEHSAH